MMTFDKLLLAAMALGPLGVLGVNLAQAAEIKILASNGVKTALEKLVPQFRATTGHRLVVQYDAAAILKRQIDSGEKFDVAILTAPIIEDLTKQGKIVPDTAAVIARSGIGVAVRAGAPRPDIGTAESFKRALLAAKSVAYTTEGASGQYFAGLLQRLGIADQVRAKATLRPGGQIARFVARGEADLAVQLIPELRSVRGVDVVGPLPPELQSYVVFPAAVGRSAKEPEVANELIRFLSTPEAARVFKSKGMEPG